MLYSQNFQEPKDLLTYDYAREEQSGFPLPDGHYEFDTRSGDMPFWEPAGVEDDLKSQLQDLSLSQDTLSWVWPPAIWEMYQCPPWEMGNVLT